VEGLEGLRISSAGLRVEGGRLDFEEAAVIEVPADE
jgi:hypothetical protein